MHKVFIILLSILTAQLTCAQTKIISMETSNSKVKENRDFFETLGKIYPAEKDIQVTQEKIAEVNCYWFKQNDTKETNILIYLHGGAFIMGSIGSHKALVSHIAKKVQIPVLFIEYSLAPENQYPIARNEVVAVYKEILVKHPEANIYIMGDSAGGGLTVSSIYSIQEEGLKAPKGVILLSPWLNLTCNTESHESRKQLDPVLSKEGLLKDASYYGGDNIKSADPSQLKFESFPPVFLLIGSNEILFDDSKHFYEYIKNIQPNAKLKEYEGQTHVWPLTNVTSAGTQEALSDIHSFIKSLNP